MHKFVCCFRQCNVGQQSQQNELLTTAGNIIKDKIVRDVKESQFWPQLWQTRLRIEPSVSNWQLWFDVSATAICFKSLLSRT